MQLATGSASYLFLAIRNKFIIFSKTPYRKQIAKDSDVEGRGHNLNAQFENFVFSRIELSDVFWVWRV